MDIAPVAHASKILLKNIARRLSDYFERVGILLKVESGSVRTVLVLTQHS